jgi:hypothetical protein
MSLLVPNTTEQDLTKFAMALRQIGEGRSNATGTFTLTANAASTAVTAVNCGSSSTVLVTPTTANAAAEIGAGTMYIGTVGNGTFTVTHANNAQADRTFLYAAFG